MPLNSVVASGVRARGRAARVRPFEASWISTSPRTGDLVDFAEKGAEVKRLVKRRLRVVRVTSFDEIDLPAHQHDRYFARGRVFAQLLEDDQAAPARQANVQKDHIRLLLTSNFDHVRSSTRLARRQAFI